MLEITAESISAKTSLWSHLGFINPNAVTKPQLNPDEESQVRALYRIRRLIQLATQDGLQRVRTPRLTGNLLEIQAAASTVATDQTFSTDTDTLQAARGREINGLFEEAEIQLSGDTTGTARYALSLLQRVRTIVEEITKGRTDGRVLTLVDAEDDSITIEWIRNRSRLGFVLDLDRESSSWFVVMPDGTSSSGYLYRMNREPLRGLLSRFVAAEEKSL